jgi:c-di-GMP-binding flagellar brake protein YcgR
MATPLDRAANVSFPEPDEDSLFLIWSVSEIRFLLSAMQQEGSLLNVRFGQSGDTILTTVLSVPKGSAHIVLDYGPDEAANRRALSSEQLVVETWLDKVKIQFQLTGLAKITYSGRPAFRAAFPEKLKRLQRRQYYRLATPVSRPVACKIPLTSKGMQGEPGVRVVDISLGGICISDQSHEVHWAVGDVFTDCRIILPEIDVVVLGLEVRNLVELALKNGAKGRRSGCRFVTAPESTLALIQRYILETERERRAKLNGLG